MPIQLIVETVWRCEALRTPPRLWTPDGTIDGADAQDLLLNEAHLVALTWSNYGTTPCDNSAAHAGVFPVPATVPIDRCDPIANIRSAARLVLDQEALPLDQRPGANDWERAAAGWATMPPAMGPAVANTFTQQGPADITYTPSEECRLALADTLDNETSATPRFGTLQPLAGFDPDAIDFDADHWDSLFAATPIGALFGPDAVCDPGTARAEAFRWLATELKN